MREYDNRSKRIGNDCVMVGELDGRGIYNVIVCVGGGVRERERGVVGVCEG